MKRKSKYNNKIVKHKGMAFHSQAEFLHYLELEQKQKDGKISGLACQPPFPLQAGSQLTTIGKYIADFAYVEGNNFIVEDVKGVKTAVYRLKRKLFEACYPHIIFREVSV